MEIQYLPAYDFMVRRTLSVRQQREGENPGVPREAGKGPVETCELGSNYDVPLPD